MTLEQLQEILARVTPADREVMDRAKKRQAELAKPPGSLGKLEEMSIRLAGITGRVCHQIEACRILVFAADNGVIAEGVSSSPESVTLSQAVNMTRHITGMSALAKYFGDSVVVADVGINADVSCPSVLNRKIRYSTRNLAKEPALTCQEVLDAMAVGLELAGRAGEEGVQAIGVGEMGIGNTTTSSAVLAALTGAPVEHMEFEEVDYWEELVEIMEWTKTHVTSTMHLCWGAQAGLYYHFGLQKKQLPEKMFGLFWHKVNNRKIPLVRGFDDRFLAPHSRHTEVPIEDIRADGRITILAESEEAGFFLGMANDGRQIFVMGHPEYDRVTLDGEYKRDLGKGLDIQLPKNYYQGDNVENKPLLMWRAHANNLYTNWLNYYVYQVTPYDMIGTPF